MVYRTEELDTPAKLIAKMQESIAQLDAADHAAVSSFVEATDTIHALLPNAEPVFQDIVADIDAATADVPPPGAEEIARLLEDSSTE